MQLFLRFTVAVLILVPSCISRPPESASRPPAGLLRDAARFYDAYGNDLRTHKRERLAQYYDAEGALIVSMNRQQRYTRVELDSVYRNLWKGPDYFSWEDLAFDQLSQDLILVTGGFKWQVQGAKDTSRFVYLAVLQNSESGLAIRVEQEMPAPKEAK